MRAMSASELGDAYRSGLLSPVDVAAELLDAIVEVNGEINAFCLVDADTTMAAARGSLSQAVRLTPYSCSASWFSATGSCTCTLQP